MKKIILAVSVAGLLTGCCSNISTQSRPYLGVPTFAAVDPVKVQILPSEPSDRPHERLGEILLDATGNPSKDDLEKKLREQAAKMGADAVFIVQDRFHIFPVVYVDPWGPWYSRENYRGIVAVAIKFK